MITFRDRDGQPVGLQELGEVDVRVARTKVGEATVSTVWVGSSDYLFETMILGGPLDEETWRHQTEEQALQGHLDALKLARQEVAQ